MNALKLTFLFLLLVVFVSVAFAKEDDSLAADSYSEGGESMENAIEEKEKEKEKPEKKKLLRRVGTDEDLEDRKLYFGYYGYAPYYGYGGYYGGYPGYGYGGYGYHRRWW